MADYWIETKKLFSSLIIKPLMTEKLLKKPPPKYIYDIVLNTMEKTNYPKGLLTEQEMTEKYFMDDAHHKYIILDKVIKFTEMVLNVNFEIKTINILYGKEPDKTNHFLQMFYKAATDGKDYTPLVQKFLEKYTPPFINSQKDNFLPNNNIIAVNFRSSDQAINYPIGGLETDNFSTFEEKLYAEFPELKNKNIFFIANGNIINRTGTLAQNKIKSGTIILIQYIE